MLFRSRVPVEDLMLLRHHYRSGKLSVLTDEEGEAILKGRRISLDEKLKLYNITNNPNADELMETLPPEVQEKMLNATQTDDDLTLKEKVETIVKTLKPSKKKKVKKAKKITS